MKTAERFSDRVQDYLKFRPGYPVEIVELFRDQMGLRKDSVIADIGCGTGQSSRPFLEFGCRVIGVEPNQAMRKGAMRFLQSYQGFSVVGGSSYDSGLEDNAVDFVIAAQAFHWFMNRETVREFTRIAKPGGFAALIWNERQIDSTSFLRDYEALLLEFGTDYESVRHDRISVDSLAKLFDGVIRKASFENQQIFDFNGIKGRLMSSSYTPAQDDPSFVPMIEKLKGLFAQHQEKGKIRVLYDTNVFYTRL